MTMTTRPSRIDPRNLFLDNPAIATVTLVALWVLFAIGNVLTPKGAIMERALTNPADPYRLMDEHVHDRIADGFRGQSEQIPFVLYFDTFISTPDDLRRIQQFSSAVETELGTPIASLSTFPHFVEIGDTISDTPHIPGEIPDDFDIEKWKSQVRADPSVYGILVGREFDYAIVSWFLPPNADEVEAFRAATSFLERRDVSEVEWLYKPDIYPPSGVGVGGGIVLHGLIDQGMNVDVYVLVAIGIAITFPLFAYAFRATPPAIIAILTVVLAGILWTRGSIGLLDWLGFPIKERVYCLIAYTNCIVQGVSFTLHKYECFYEALHAAAGNGKGEISRAEIWRNARSIDGLIVFAASIAILGFATLYSFDVRAIRECGLLSAIGVLTLLFNSTVLLPAVDSWLMRKQSATTHEPRIERALSGLSSLVARVSPRTSLSCIAAVTTIACALVVLTNAVPIWSRHVDFAGPTHIRETADYLNAPGRSGFEVVELLVESGAGNATRDPEFLARATAFEERVRSLDDTREIASILAAVRQISHELLGKPLPQTQPEAAAIFNTLDAGLERALAANLYFRGGVRMSLYTAIERSDLMSEYIEKVLHLARDEFPELSISTYGANALYPQWDTYIRYGKPLNVLSSQWVVVMMFMLRILVVNRRFRLSGTPTINPLIGGLVAATPFVFSSSILVFLLAGTQTPLDAATASVTALAINAAIDFSIYIVDAIQKNLRSMESPLQAATEAVRQKGRVVLADMLLNGLCMTPLLISSFPSLRQVGMIMPVMVLSCAFGALVLLPSIMSIAVRGARRPSAGSLGST